jgi:HK97 family phage prohead protease
MTRATRFSAPVSKLLDAPTLGARQILAVVSDSTLDRTRDVMRPEGAVLDNYRQNPIVLANHDPRSPIGTAVPAVRNGRVEALINFAPAGASPIADTYCNLAKAGVLRAMSVGFDPIEVEPSGKGGYNFNKWELLEVSVVSVPANPGATVFARSHAKDGRVLAGEHADRLDRAHRRITAARKDLADVLKAAGREPLDDADDEELAFAPAWLKQALPRQARDEVPRDDPERERRHRQFFLARMRLSPDMLMPSAAEREALERRRFLERMRCGP